MSQLDGRRSNRQQGRVRRELLTCCAVLTDWVRDAWDQDFTVCDELPVETDEDLQQSGFHLTELRAASKALKPWIQHQAEEGEGTLWFKLLENRGLRMVP